MTNANDLPGLPGDETPPRSPLVQVSKIVGLVIGLIFCSGVIAGIMAAHSEHGGGIDAKFLAIVTPIILIMIACVYGLFRLIARSAKAMGDERLTTRERLNRNIMIACLFSGGVIGVILAVMSDNNGSAPSVYDDGPLPPALAIGFAVFWGLIMPLISWYWHNRATDELEADAYRTGAMMACYVLWIGAPVWWVLWRGGLLPEPDGVTIYMATIFTALIIWQWKKYR